jgi:hypothetical protein
MSYRQGKVLYFNEKNWQVTDHPPVAEFSNGKKA